MDPVLITTSIVGEELSDQEKPAAVNRLAADWHAER